MRIQAAKFNTNPVFYGKKREYKTPVLNEINLEEAEVLRSPFYSTTCENREINERDVKKVSHAIQQASSYKLGDDGYPGMKESYFATFYDLPISFALNLKEKQKRGEDTHIIDEIPEMFEGLDINNVCKVLDVVNLFMDKSFSGTKINIEGRDFKFRWLDCGVYGDVYKITSEGYPPLAFKVFCHPKGIGNNGPFGEIAIERELSKAGVIDVPKFYMASPLGKLIKEGHTMSPVSCSSWKISEFITEDTPKKEGNLTLDKFLIKKGLLLKDRHQKNFVGDYWVDLGGISGIFVGGSFYEKYGYDNTCPISRIIDNPKSYDDFLKEDKDC